MVYAILSSSTPGSLGDLALALLLMAFFGLIGSFFGLFGLFVGIAIGITLALGSIRHGESGERDPDGNEPGRDEEVA